MISVQTKPRAGDAGHEKMNRNTCVSRILARIPGLCQIKTLFIDKDVIKQQRQEEKPMVYQAQLSRARRQLLAFQLWGSIDRWREIPAEAYRDE